MNKTKLLLGIFMLVFTPLMMFASAKPVYISIIDAGSSGSRIYLYKIDTSSNQVTAMPMADQKSTKVKPGLSAYIDNPQAAESYIKPLLDNLENTLKTNKIDKADLYCLATAGMRTLSPALETTLYSQLADYVKANYPDLNVKNMQTISGSYEGTFDWIAANELENTLFNNNSTYGILDMGGASTEIAYAISEQTDSSNHALMNFNLGKHSYVIYSHSYLGLGEDLTRSQYTNDAACFPSGCPLPNEAQGSGDYFKCLHDIQSLICLHRVHRPCMLPSNSKFIAFSGYYYIAQFFGLDKGNFTIDNLFRQGVNLSRENWQNIENEHPNDPYLFSYYFNSAYIVALLNSMGFSHDKPIQVADKINDNDIDFALGAVVFFAYGNTIKTIYTQGY